MIKTACFHYYIIEMQHIGHMLSEHFDGLAAHANEFIGRKQRFYFLQEVFLLVFSYFQAFVLFLAICIEVKPRESSVLENYYEYLVID